MGIIQSDRDAAAALAAQTSGAAITDPSIAACIEGKMDDSLIVQHFARYRRQIIEQERLDTEVRLWTILDADGPCGAPSDIWGALDTITRAARNRDMWKGQCERQAAKLTALSIALHDAIARPMGVAPESAEAFYCAPVTGAA